MDDRPRRRQGDNSAGLAGSVQQQLDEKATKPIHSEGGVNGRHCVLCKEQGMLNVTAHEMVTIKPRSGGEPRKVAVCSSHVKSLGEPSSPYLVDELARSFPTRGSARPRAYVPGKRKGGDIPRTMRKTERYGRTQRGRLGE
ncbi:MAG TPA: hypothetical protein VND40_04925 [Nitrososphaerales archaeon]|nr:hypothetical protein [Nitrososphaerales archaeon]